MKLLLPLLLIICSNAFAQKLVTNKTDEFTGKKVKETSVETLARPLKMSGFSYDFTFKKVDEDLFFKLKIMSLSNSVFAIKDGGVFMIKMEDDSIISLSNSEYTISKTGGGSSGFSGSAVQGATLYFPVSKQYADLLKSKKIVKVRIYTTEGYSEQDVKSNADKKIKAALALIL